MGVASRTDTINVWVAATVRPRRSPEIWQLFRDAVGPRPDPEDLTVYLTSLANAWGLLFCASGLLMVGLAFTANAVFGETGNLAGRDIFCFVLGFCLVGEFDALWRYSFARRASRLARTESDNAARLVRMARANDGGIILQLLGGLLATSIAALVWG